MRYPACRFSFDLLAFLLVWPVRSANVFTVQLCVSFLACAHTHVCTHTLGRTIEHPNIPLSNLSPAHVAPPVRLPWTASSVLSCDLEAIPL